MARIAYVPHDWSDNDLITEDLLDHMEQGIFNIDTDLTTLDNNFASALNALNSAQESIDEFQTTFNTLQTLSTTVQNEVSTYVNNTVLPDIQNAIANIKSQAETSLSDLQQQLDEVALKTDIYGSTTVDNGNENSLKEWINTQLTTLRTTINSDMSPKLSNIGDIIGNDYDITTGLGQNTDSISTRLTSIYSAIFGNGSSGNKTIIEQITDLNNDVNDLTTAIFGSSNNDNSASLKEKIEGMVGRSLDLENNETIDEQTGEYSNSIMTAINQIKGVLSQIKGVLGIEGGISGEGSSNLVQDVNTALNILYGYHFIEEHEDPEDDTSPVISRTLVRNSAPNLNNLNLLSSYPNLYSDFYTTTLTYANVDSNEPNATKTTNAGILAILNSLGSDFGKVASSSKTAKDTIDTYKSSLQNIDKAYSKADTTTIEGDTYLILSPINQEAQEEEVATTVEGINTKKSRYIKLPKGGGGGTGSNYFARIENITRPQNRNISIGDDHIYSFSWMAYQLSGTQTQQEVAYGEMKVAIGGVVVFTKIIDSSSKTLVNDEYEYDLSNLVTVNIGQYIKSTGRKNITITIVADGYENSILNGYVIAYAPSLIVDLDITKVFSSNTINFNYLATVGSDDIEKVLYAQIDGKEVNDNGINTTYLESSYSPASIETPLEDKGHVLTVYFKYRLDENSPWLESLHYNYGIITNRGSSTKSFITTDLSENIRIVQYDQIVANYMAYSSISNTHTIKIYIYRNENNTLTLFDSDTLEVENLTLPEIPWVYTFETPGAFVIEFKVDDEEDTKCTYNILVDLNQQYQFVLQRPQNLLLNLSPNGRSNQEPASIRNTWNNSENKENSLYNDISIQMNNFLFSDRNKYDGWLKDENNKSILRLRNTDEVIINNCPLLRQANSKVGLTFEIEFKTSDVVNLQTIFFEQADAGLNIEQLRATVTSKWNTELQYRRDIESLFYQNYNNNKGKDPQTGEDYPGEGEYYDEIYASVYDAILEQLITENNKLLQEEQKTQEELEEEASKEAPLKTKNKILELATEEIVGNNSRPYLEWTEENYQTELIRVATEQSIILTPQNFIGNARAKTELQYKEEELTTISYVFNPEDSGDNTLLIYCYINGILSNIKRYDRALNQATNSFIRIGSLECTTDIYAIRLYNTALTSKEVVQNWIYGLSDPTEKINAFIRNNYGNETLTDEIFAAHSTSTPYMVIKASGPLESANAMPQAKGSKFATTVELRYVDPANPENNFTSSETSIQVQGTSSQFYPRKNYKLKLKNFTQNNILHKAKKKETDPETVSTEGYKLFDNSVPVFNFCIKADYASSEGVNNTGLARLYDDIVRNFYKTPPQKLDETNSIRQAIDGKPMVVFYEEGYINSQTGLMEYKTPYFLGKYNFNNDKGTHEVFGLKTFQKNWYYEPEDKDEKNPLFDENTPYIGDESWEGADNFYPLNIFVPISINGERGYKKQNDLNTNDWKATFPARFPGVWEDYPAYADHSNWYNAIKWVYDTRTVVWKQYPEGHELAGQYYDAAADENDPDYYVGPDIEHGKTRDEVLQEHLAKFKAEFTNYFNLPAMLFFFVFTEFFLMVDNRAKNMFWTRYLTTANRNKDDVLAVSNENQTYDKYFSLPYDFDTAMGIDNQGMFQFNYNLENSDGFMPDGSLIYNGYPSIFWTNFVKAFEKNSDPDDTTPTIEKTFIDLLDGSFEDPLYPNDRTKVFRFNYESVEKRFEQHQSAWSETIFNEDAMFKYIKAHANYFMAQGSKKEQRQWWLFNRFRYFSSKYRAGGISSTDIITLRALSSGTITVSTIADCYVTFQLSSDAGVVDSLDTERVLTKKGEVTLTLPKITANNAVINIYPASAIRSISGLSSLLLQTVNFNAAEKIQYLTIGSNTSSNSSLTEVNISNNPLLRHLDVRRCTAFSVPLDLQICSSLETIYLAGTTITSITLPDGGILKTVQYPESINTIIISNQPYLQHIIIGNYLPDEEIAAGRDGTSIQNQVDFEYDNLQTISFNNTTATNDIADIIIKSENLNNCTLINLDFTMSGAKFKQLFNKLVAIKNINDTEHSIIGQVNITNCKLHLTDNLPEDLSVNTITTEFDFKVFAPSGSEFFNVKFYDFSHTHLIQTLSVSGGSSPIVDSINAYFTEEYLNSYNGITNANIREHPTRISFGGWDKPLTNISEDLAVYPIEITQYRLDYHYLIDENTPAVQSRFFTEGAIISGIPTPTFIKDYYKYEINYWTADSNAPLTYPDDDNRVSIYANAQEIYKQPFVEEHYLVYKHDSPANYTITVYNTNLNGEPTEIIGTIYNKHVVGDNDTTISRSELDQFNPAVGGVSIDGLTPSEKNINLDNRKYKFLNWQPNIWPNDRIHVTGNMNFYLKYYKVDDDFTNYFLNKLEKCELHENVTSLPKGAFMHNSNLIKLTTIANTIGDYSFCNFNGGHKRYFVFGQENSPTNLYLGKYVFANIQNAIILYLGTGQIIIQDSAFYNVRNCKILLPNTNYPIINNSSDYGSFSSFIEDTQNNLIYVKDTTVLNAYSTNGQVPQSLPTHTEQIRAITIEGYLAEYTALREEVDNQ